jgi:hypothetical protein
VKHARSHFASPVATLLLVTATAACTPDGSDQDSARNPSARLAGSSRFESHFQWKDTIVLEEGQGVVNVQPLVSVDRTGDFIVADQSENRIRVYRPTGALVRQFGGKGGGPEEFQGLIGAFRSGADDLVVMDQVGKLAVFPAGSGPVQRTVRLPLSPAYGADLVGDTLLLVAARTAESKDSGSLLHLVNLRTLSISRSFFTPPPVLKGHPIESAVGFITARVQNDTIAAVYSISDTIYLFSLDGRPAGKIPFRAPGFRSMKTAPPRGQVSKDKLFEWVSGFSLVTHAFQVPNGDFLVQYQDRQGSEMKWRLARVTRRGETLFDVADSPMLLATADQGSRLIFVHPLAEVPNKWISASLVQ